MSPSTTPAPKKRKEKKPKHAPPLYYASVTQTADEAPARVSAASMAGADEGVLSRIKKCLQRARDAGAAEQEAKAALRLASKMITQLNVTQADVLAHEDEEERKKHGGQSTLSALSNAIQTFFDCKCYTSGNSRVCETTFYGIAENTVAAAEAFCMVYNLAVEWARPYKGVKGKGSYCLGLSNELQQTADDEKIEEERRAKESEEEQVKTRTAKEDAERQAQLGRLAAVPEDSVEPISTEARAEQDDANQEDGCLSIPGPLTLGERAGDAQEIDHHTQWEEWDGFSDDSDDDGEEDGDAAHGTGWTQTADFCDDDSDNDSGLGDLAKDDVDAHIDNLVAAMNQHLDPDEDATSERSLSMSPTAHDSGTDVQSKSQANCGDQADTATTAAAQISVKPNQGEDHAVWDSHKQLICFRDAAGSIADNFLEDSDIKLQKGRKRKAVQYDWDAYDQGVRDSKKIDVRRKPLCDGHVELITGGTDMPSA